MNIIEHKFAFAIGLSNRKSTAKIVLHHAAAKSCSVDDIHRWHLGNGWAGIGYHFLVRKDGSVHEGRPIETVGAHTGDENYNSIGICFEGNFETETMSTAQKEAGAELVTYVKGLYPSIKTVGKHKDYNATACPGKNFPFEEIAYGEPEETPKNEAGMLELYAEPLYVSSTAEKKTGVVTGTYYLWSNEVILGRVKITNMPENIGKAGQVTGWIDAPKTKKLEKGCLVRLKKDAKTYTGGSLASFVYERNHTVKEINGDRVVITFGGVVVAAVNKKDLTLV